MKIATIILIMSAVLSACGRLDDIPKTDAAVAMIPEADATEWQIKGSRGEAVGHVQANTRLSLFDSYSGEFLKYTSREFGINLGLSSSFAAGFSVSRSSQNDHGLVKYGEPIALKIDGGGYLKYATRDRGINLTWSNSPVLEWEIRGGAVGSPVVFSTKVALFNRYVNQNLVYCVRELTVNLAWAKDCNFIGGGRIRIP